MDMISHFWNNTIRESKYEDLYSAVKQGDSHSAFVPMVQIQKSSATA